MSLAQSRIPTLTLTLTPTLSQGRGGKSGMRFRVLEQR